MEKKISIAIIALTILGCGGYFGYTKAYVPWQQKKVAAKAEAEAKAKYEAAMTTDKIGGQTAKETVDSLIKELKAGNLENASKYFLLDETLTHDRWLQGLQQAKEKGVIKLMISDLSRAKFIQPGNSADEEVWQIKSADGKSQMSMILVKNTYSGVWKIGGFQ